MGNRQKYGIKYPFTSDNNDGMYLDLNESHADSIKSQVLHVIFTPKGQKLRDPEFGTNLTKFLFEPSVDETFDSIKNEITTQVSKYVPSVEFRDISIYTNEDGGEEYDDNEIIIIVEYGVRRGASIEITKVAVKL